LVNVYSLDKAEPKTSLSGHSSFVYSVVAFPDGKGAISTGEDGTMRVWSSTSLSPLAEVVLISDTELIQTIPHSSNSIWSSAVVPGMIGPGAYIASSSNDATIRFFTKDEGLKAPQAEREEWDKQVSSRALDKYVYCFH
jgi:phospholipase A-2-activating protein